MDDNTKDVLVLAITTFSTIAIAWIRIRGHRNGMTQDPVDPAGPTPPAPPGTPSV
jgi:hypothetical protein